MENTMTAIERLTKIIELYKARCMGNYSFQTLKVDEWVSVYRVIPTLSSDLNTWRVSSTENVVDSTTWDDYQFIYSKLELYAGLLRQRENFKTVDDFETYIKALMCEI